MNGRKIRISGWKPGQAREYTEDVLVEHLLYATADRPPEWIAERVGVHENTVKKWRRAPLKNLSDGLEQRIRDLLTELGHPELRA